MTLLVIKAVISGVLIALISEIARKYPGLGALIASVPLISIFAMIWMWIENKNANNIADHAEATFWLVLPTLPMFLIIPFLLRANWNIWLVLTLSITITIIFYLITIKFLSFTNIKI
tara:strand:- start:441 stop:791 length:351 start_codon:yes stop_codon:yes gene_type:complete